MVRLTRLKIDRFRNVKPGTDLSFGPTFNALLGKNATGKSTLLDLVAAVTNDDLSAYAEQDAGFDLTWWIEQDDHKVRVERALVAARTDEPRATVLDPAGLLPVHPAQAVFSPTESAERIDKALLSLETITCLPAEVTRGGVLWDGWWPRGMKDALVTGSGIVTFRSLPGLDEIPALLGFTDAEVHPRAHARSEDGRVVYGSFDCLFTRSDGSRISHKLLSFGQKRLFSFLWYLAVREHLPVVADELFNGFHHQWIEVCFDRLYNRQSFLATQHPYLLDYIPIESAEGVSTTFIRCNLGRGPDGREQMVWRNLDEDEAERFYVAYQTGIAQVSDVLRMEGFW